VTPLRSDHGRAIGPQPWISMHGCGEAMLRHPRRGYIGVGAPHLYAAVIAARAEHASGVIEIMTMDGVSTR
jgi:hypothetical protein